MPSHRNNHRSHRTQAQSQQINPNESEQQRDYLDRLAVLVTNGELPIPDGLNAAHRKWLIEKVAEQRQRQLVRYIARAIALDIDRSRES